MTSNDKPEKPAAKISKYLTKTAGELFDDPARRAAFVEAVLSPLPRATAIVWCKPKPEQCELELPAQPAPFQPPFVELAAPGLKPGSLPLHDEGYYYCLDLSSVFAAAVLTAVQVNREAIGSGPRVLDACAAPGGKAVLAARHLNPSHLVANDAIRKRCGPLIGNLRRCGITPATVTSSDSSFLAAHYRQSFDVTIVDVPCSGQSLLAKGKTAHSAFHPATVNLNSNRQRRIISNCADTVAPGGYLAYMTCTYAVKENEKVLEWFLKHNPDFRSVDCPALSDFASHLSDIACYRLLPGHGLGAGAFTALLQRDSESGTRLPEAQFRTQLETAFPVWSSQWQTAP